MIKQQDKNTIENLKKMLISRDINLQMSAADFILKNLRKTKSNSDDIQTLIESLISNDVCIYLAEASGTLHIKLLRKIVLCLKSLSVAKIFFKDSNAAYVTASLIRAIYFHVKEDTQENIVQCIMYFISDIFTQVNSYGSSTVLSTHSPFDSIQILNLLQSIVDDTKTSSELLLISSKMFHTMFPHQAKQLKFSHKLVDNTVILIRKIVLCLCNLLVETESKLEQSDSLSCIFGMICHISIDTLNFCSALNSDSVMMDSQNIIEEERQMYAQEVKNIAIFTHKIVKFIARKIKSYEESLDVSCYETFLKFLYTFMNEPLVQDVIPEFTTFLVRNDFLVFLPRLRIKSTNHQFKKSCQINLGEILLILSYQNFDLNQWEGGKIGFRNHLLEGLLNNEDDLNNWPNVLFSKCVSDATLNSLLIYLYFYCLNPLRSQKIEHMLLPCLVHYILNIPERGRCPLPVTKCLWFLFAISSSLQSDSTQIKNGRLDIERSNSKLVRMVSVNTKIIYTHHHVIIQWIYSSERIPVSLQNIVLKLWLELEVSLPSCLLSLNSVWFSLMDILEDDNEIIVKRAAVLLEHCIKNVCDEKYSNIIKNSLWESLPNILTIYRDDKMSNDTSLLCMMNLCRSNIPNEPNFDIMCRSAFLLTELSPVLGKNGEEFMYSFIAQACCLMSVTLQNDNTLVLARFINSDVLIDTIYNATLQSNEDLSLMAYNFLSTSFHYQGIYNLNSNKTLILSLSLIIRLLKDEKNEGKCTAILRLIFTLFQMTCSNSSLKPLISIDADYLDDIQIKSLSALYFRIQMVCCEESKTKSEGGWQCLNSIMEFSFSNKYNKIIDDIISEPWTHVLIRFYLAQVVHWKVHKNFLVFICKWLMFNTKITENESNKNNVKNEQLIQTMSLLAITFDSQIRNKMHEEKKKMAENILQMISDFRKVLTN